MLIASLKTSRRSSAKYNRAALHHIAVSRGRSTLAALPRLAAVNGRQCKSTQSCGVSRRRGMGLKALVRDFLPPVVLRLLQSLKSSPRPSLPGTIAAAQQAGISVGDYVEQLWGNPGGSAKVIQKLFDIGAISP